MIFIPVADFASEKIYLISGPDFHICSKSFDFPNGFLAMDMENIASLVKKNIANGQLWKMDENGP